MAEQSLAKRSSNVAKKPASSETVKISASLPKQTYEALQELAGLRNITLTEALRRAIELERFLMSQNKVIVEGEDKKLREIVRL